MTQGMLIPFGKYKNQPVEVLAEDPGYREWLEQQPWVRERFQPFYTFIINNFQSPNETPEHNALQIQFIEYDFRARVSAAALMQLDPAWLATATLIAPVGMPTFEERGIDVAWDVHAWSYDLEAARHAWRFQGATPAVRDDETPPPGWYRDAKRTFLCECKPSLGDDYPAVLRSMRAARHEHEGSFGLLIVETCAARGAPLEAIRAFFRLSGNMLVLTMAEIKATLPLATTPPKALPIAPRTFFQEG